MCPESDTGVTKAGARKSLKRLLRTSDVSKNTRVTKGRKFDIAGSLAGKRDQGVTCIQLRQR